MSLTYLQCRDQAVEGTLQRAREMDEGFPILHHRVAVLARTGVVVLVVVRVTSTRILVLPLDNSHGDDVLLTCNDEVVERYEELTESPELESTAKRGELGGTDDRPPERTPAHTRLSTGSRIERVVVCDHRIGLRVDPGGVESLFGLASRLVDE